MSLNKKNEELNSFLYELLVPGMGNTSTTQGEMLRAYNRIAYRWYNDGDMIHTGYGIETAAPAWCYLKDVITSPKIKSILMSLSSATSDSNYDKLIDDLGEELIPYIYNSLKERISKFSDGEDYDDYKDVAIDTFGDPNDWEDDDDWEDDEYDEY
jgi:hypothetical protein